MAQSELLDEEKTRSYYLKEKTKLTFACKKIKEEMEPGDSRAFKELQAQLDQQFKLEDVLKSDFLPNHSKNQLISPKTFFISPLFRVSSKKSLRAKTIELDFLDNLGQRIFKYSGPELRQSDGLVFMALLNLVKDIKIGEKVSFEVESFCKQVFGRYDGPARSQLKQHIQRLQKGLIELDQFSVQLCLRFDFPSKGNWSVALDKDILVLFQKSSFVWLDFEKRKSLPEGLATWLYAFIESQVNLIPVPVYKLKELCGSDANDDSFLKTLKISLKNLEEKNIIDNKWFVKNGILHWKAIK